jgi:ABC-type glycerol-3-phosphate transport system substrate-binding protein
MSRRQLLRRLATLGTGLVAAGPILAACGPTPTPQVIRETVVVEKEKIVEKPVKETVVVEKEVVKEVPAVAEPITLRQQVFAGTCGMHQHEFAKRFMKWKPHITVKNEDIRYGDILSKTEMGHAVGNVQDVCYGHSEWLWQGVTEGFYRSLEDLIKANPPPDFDDFYKICMDNERYPDDGQIYSIPSYFHLGGNILVTWNRELLEAKGLKMPWEGWHMEEMVEMALAATDVDKGIFGVDFRGLTHQLYWENLTRAWGNPEYGRDGDTRGWQVGPQGKKWQFYNWLGSERFYNDVLRPLLDAKAHPKQEDMIEGGLFAAGRQALRFSHGNDPISLYLRIDKWDYFPQDTQLAPLGPDERQPQCHSSNMFMVSNLSKHPAEALELIGYMTSTEAGVWNALVTGCSHLARQSVITHPKVLELNPAYNILDALYLTGEIEPYPMPDNYRYKELLDIYRNTTDPLRLATKSWEEQAPIVQTEVQKLMDLPRPGQ